VLVEVLVEVVELVEVVLEVLEVEVDVLVVEEVDVVDEVEVLVLVVLVVTVHTVKHWLYPVRHPGIPASLTHTWPVLQSWSVRHPCFPNGPPAQTGVSELQRM
jgi:hypothetical protein